MFTSTARPRKDTPAKYDVQLYKFLGAGNTAEVDLMRFRRLGLVVARKIIKDTNLLGGLQSALRSEIAIHSRLFHPNIIQMVGFEMGIDCTILYLEYAPHGSLIDFTYSIRMNDPMALEHTAAKLTLGILDALAYLKKRDIVHRDLKSENILIGVNKIVKLADFGAARQGSSRKITSHPDDMAGTVGYHAPEMLQENTGRYDGFKADLWALGCVVYSMYAGSLPFDYKIPRSRVGTRDEAAIMKGRILKLAYTFPTEACFSPLSQDFIKKLLVLDPEARPSIDDLRSHAWLALAN